MRHSVFYMCVAGYVSGIFLSSLFSLPFIFTILVGIFGMTGIFECIYSQTIFQQHEIKIYSKKFLIFIFCVWCAFGMIRFALFIRDHGDSTLKQFVGENIEGEGTLIEEPDERDTTERLIVRLDSLFDGEKTIHLKPTNIVVSTGLHEHIAYGDRIHVEGTLKEPENFRTSSGELFDYVHYLAKDKIFYTISYPQMSILAHTQGNIFKYFLFSMKKYFIHVLDRVIPFPESRLAAGLTVAGKRALPQTIQDDFQKSGTLQIVVLSGYNITIISETIELLFSFLPLFFSTILSALSIIGFVIMTGGSATIVRGGVMALIALFGNIVRRKYDVLRALIITALLMLILNPLLLVFDPSFQLSFCATLGLVLLSPHLKKYFLWIPERFNVREIVVATCSAQLAVLPLLIASTHEINLISIPANIILSLLVPCVMLVCFTTAIGSMIVGFLMTPMSWIGYGLLSCMLYIVHTSATISWLSIPLPDFPKLGVTLIYMCYIVFILKMKRHETPKLPTILK